jgi:iron complex transport system ATP-binding protein
MTIVIDDLSYQDILKNISCTLNQGELIIVLGKNGAGKTTFLKNILTLLNPSSGSILCDDTDIKLYSNSQRAKKISYVPQHKSIAWALTVKQMTALGALNQGKTSASFEQDDNHYLNDILKKCDLYDMQNRMIDTLSGGESMRLWIARCLMARTPYIIADEPITGLDIDYQFKIMNIFKDLTRQNHGCMMSLHDIGLALKYADKILILDKNIPFIFDTPHNIIQSKILESIFDIQIVQTDFGHQKNFLINPLFKQG